MESNKIDLRKMLNMLEKALVFLPLLTAVTYLGAYFFEMAYLSMYDIPAQFIQIKTENFLFLLLGSAFICTVAFAAYDEHKHSWQDKNKLQKMLHISLFGVALVLWLLLALPPFMSLGLAVALAIVIPLRRFAPGLFRRKSRKVREHTLLQKMIVLTLPIIFMVSLFSYMAGRVWAISQDNYAVVDIPQGKYAVIQAYGDSYLLTKVNIKEGQDFLILSLRTFRDI